MQSVCSAFSTGRLRLYGGVRAAHTVRTMNAILSTDDENSRPTSAWQVIQSVLWSFFGVQSSKNRQRDFTRGKPIHYLVAALLMTGVVALIFYAAVQLVLHFAVN